MKKETIYLVAFLLVIGAVAGYVIKWIADDQKAINSTKEYLKSTGQL
jgi:hypothetical protein